MATSGMATVVHVIPVIDVVHINVVGFVPCGRPVFRPRINQIEPEAAVRESGDIPPQRRWGRCERETSGPGQNANGTGLQECGSPVTSAFAPTMMFTLPIVGAVILPNISLFEVVFVFVAVGGAHVLGRMRRLVIWLPFRPVVAFPLLLAGVLFAPLLVVHSLGVCPNAARSTSVRGLSDGRSRGAFSESPCWSWSLPCCALAGPSCSEEQAQH